MRVNMKKEKLTKLIENYQKENPEEDLSKLLDFLKVDSNNYSRTNLFGHVTCSSWILNDDEEEVFLIHHAKYDKWLQPGGHMEEAEDIYDSALREGLEETGLTDLKLKSKQIFDIDIHKIPDNKKKGEPEHYHFDIRLLMDSKNMKANVCEKEVKGYSWVKLDVLKLITNDESLSRMVNKTKDFIKREKKLNNKHKF